MTTAILIAVKAPEYRLLIINHGVAGIEAFTPSAAIVYPMQPGITANRIDATAAMSSACKTALCGMIRNIGCALPDDSTSGMIPFFRSERIPKIAVIAQINTVISTESTRSEPMF